MDPGGEAAENKWLTFKAFEGFKEDTGHML